MDLDNPYQVPSAEVGKLGELDHKSGKYSLSTERKNASAGNLLLPLGQS